MPDTVEVKLTAMAHGGSALGRHEGRVIFVPYAIPGETVRAELVDTRERWAQARLVEVVVPSEHRVEPPCPYFGPGMCGGCHFQHIAYEAQAEIKGQVVADQLARVGGFAGAPVQEIIGAAQPWGYLNYVRFSQTVDGRLGFLTADTHDVVAVDECPIMDPLLDEVWSGLDMEWPQLCHLSLRCGSATGDRMAIFELDHYEDFDIETDAPVSCVILLADGEAVVLLGRPHLMEHVAGRDYRISPGSRFPANTAGAEALVQVVHGMVAPQGDETLLDLYCGVGLFGLSLADSVGRVIGIEQSKSAVDDLRYNSQGLDNVTAIEGEVESTLIRMATEGRAVHLAVLEPPRAGAGRRALAEMARLGPRRIAYLSCDPATLARDARQLAEVGYRLRDVQPIDLFPQAFHVEAVALFERG